MKHIHESTVEMEARTSRASASENFDDDQSVSSHARALIDSYGIKMAREIAQTNASIEAQDHYWREVASALSP